MYLFKKKVALKPRIPQLRHPFKVIENLIGNGVIIPESLDGALADLIKDVEETAASIEDVDKLLTGTINIVRQLHSYSGPLRALINS